MAAEGDRVYVPISDMFYPKVLTLKNVSNVLLLSQFPSDTLVAQPWVHGNETTKSLLSLCFESEKCWAV
jgi:hypothetical protein